MVAHLLPLPQHFSFAPRGQHKGMCMGCRTGNWEGHTDFWAYDLKGR